MLNRRRDCNKIEPERHCTDKRQTGNNIWYFDEHVVFHSSLCKSLLERAVLPVEQWLTSIEGLWVARCVSQPHTKLLRPQPHSSVCRSYSVRQNPPILQVLPSALSSNGISSMDTGPSMEGALGNIHIIVITVELVNVMQKSNRYFASLHTMDWVKNECANFTTMQLQCLDRQNKWGKFGIEIFFCFEEKQQ